MAKASSITASSDTDEMMRTSNPKSTSISPTITFWVDSSFDFFDSRAVPSFPPFFLPWQLARPFAANKNAFASLADATMDSRECKSTTDSSVIPPFRCFTFKAPPLAQLSSSLNTEN